MNSFENKVEKYQSNAVDTKEGTLILDSHKLSYHYDRVLEICSSSNENINNMDLWTDRYDSKAKDWYGSMDGK